MIKDMVPSQQVQRIVELEAFTSESLNSKKNSSRRGMKRRKKPLLELFFFLLKLSFGNWKKAAEAFPLKSSIWRANIKTTQAANC